MKSTILIGGQKGGTGKSTIATNLATMCRIAGFDTMLVDCDKQQTSLNYTARRTAKELQPQLICSKLSGNQIHVQIEDFAAKYDIVVIDVGGQDSEELRAAMITKCVSKVIVPIQAGYFDLETLVMMDDLIRVSKIYNPNLDAFAVVNRAPTHKKVTIAEEAIEFIENELEHLNIMRCIVHDRISYGYSVAKGQCVFEYELNNSSRDTKSSFEMQNLFKEVFGIDFVPSQLDEEYLNLLSKTG